MAISDEQYIKLAQYIIETCTASELKAIMSGDFTALRAMIVDELLLVDYQGTIIDIIFEDLFTQKKKPLLKKELGELTDFLMSDISLIYLKHNLSKLMKK